MGSDIWLFHGLPDRFAVGQWFRCKRATGFFGLAFDTAKGQAAFKVALEVQENK